MFEENEILNGTYRILRPIGHGGMGVIYLAYHIRLRKYVVVKRITRSFSGNLSARTEVDILKNLHHPNLPQVYDFVQDGHAVYTVIDYVDGTDLESYIKSGERPSEKQLICWFRQIAEVLAYLHTQAQPIIHSDVKPGNIIINSNGDAVLIDFNISLGGESEGVTGYSLPYASPEQIAIARAYAQGWPPEFELDGRTDIYSLGASFYRLISGMPPMIEEESFPLARMELEYNEAFLRVIDKAMRIDRTLRFSSAKKMIAALDRVKRQNRQYRTYLIMQCAVFLIGIVLISSGMYCIITGQKEEKERQFFAAVTQAYNSYSSGNAERTEEACAALLNSSEYASLLHEHPTEQCRLLCILGDVAYEREDYSNARRYYAQALDYAAERTEKTRCLRGSILSYAESGNLEAAKNLLETAKQQGMDSNNLLLIETVIYARNHQPNECFESASSLLKQSVDSELCSRACLAAADAASDAATEIKWLEKALQYGQKNQVLRGLIVAYLKQGREERSTEAVSAALTYCQTLIQSPYALKTDWLNYAAALQMSGKGTDAARTLETLLEKYPGDYMVIMNLAFAYDSIGNGALAKQYCAQAISAWMTDVSPDKLPADSEEILSLKELQRKYG